MQAATREEKQRGEDGMKDLERCDREIREIQERPDVVAGHAPAWLVALGINDWTVERSLIVAEARRSGSPQPALPS